MLFYTRVMREEDFHSLLGQINRYCKEIDISDAYSPYEDGLIKLGFPQKFILYKKCIISTYCTWVSVGPEMHRIDAEKVSHTVFLNKCREVC